MGKVEVLDTGAEPKKQLRFLFAEGTSERAKMFLELDASTKVQGQSIDIDMGMDYVMKTSLLGAPTPEKAEMDVVIESFSLDSNKTSAMFMQGESMMKSMLEGLKGKMSLDHRGQILDVGYDMSGVPSAMRESLSQIEDSLKGMTTSLPEEAVGVGAKWRLYQNITSQGIKIRQRVDMTLTKLDGAMVHLKMDVAQAGDAQEAKMATLPPGASARVTSFGSEGSGSMVLDLKGVVPFSSELNLRTTGKFKLKIGGQSSNMTMRAKTKVSIDRMD